MNTPVREGETIEGSRTMRNRPYPVLKCSNHVGNASLKIGVPTPQSHPRSLRSSESPVAAERGRQDGAVERACMPTLASRVCGHARPLQPPAPATSRPSTLLPRHRPSCPSAADGLLKAIRDHSKVRAHAAQTPRATAISSTIEPRPHSRSHTPSLPQSSPLLPSLPLRCRSLRCPR